MIYSLTDKLKFDENPVIEVKGKKITVNSDAITVLKLLDLIQNKDPMESARVAGDILFSEKDKKTIESLHLKFEDYSVLLATAIQLAVGENPDEAPGEAESRTTI